MGLCNTKKKKKVPSSPADKIIESKLNYRKNDDEPDPNHDAQILSGDDAKLESPIKEKDIHDGSLVVSKKEYPSMIPSKITTPIPSNTLTPIPEIHDIEIKMVESEQVMRKPIGSSSRFKSQVIQNNSIRNNAIVENQNIEGELLEIINALKQFDVILYDTDGSFTPSFEIEIQAIAKGFFILKKITVIENALDFIDTFSYKSIIIITNGSSGKHLIPKIQDKNNIYQIYLYLNDQIGQTEWLLQYQDQITYQTNDQSILSKELEAKLWKWYKENCSLRSNMPVFLPVFSFNDVNQVDQNHPVKLYLKSLPDENLKDRSQAKIDFVTLSRKVCKDSVLIDQFDKEYNDYNMKDVLSWYSKQCFFSKLVNAALNLEHIDSIQSCRLIIKDLQAAIKEHYHNQSKAFYGVVYRTTYLCEDQFNILKENIGKDIELLGFMTANKTKNKIDDFLKRKDTQKAIFTIIIPEPIHGLYKQEYAELSEFIIGDMEEDEIILNIMSRLTVFNAFIEKIYDQELYNVILIYGANELRKHMYLKDPVVEVNIPNITSTKCTNCQKNYNYAGDRKWFIDLNDQTCFSCYACISQMAFKDNCLMLMIQSVLKIGNSISIKVPGFRLKTKDRVDCKFIGLKCLKCEEKYIDIYFRCIGCPLQKSIMCYKCFNETNPCSEKGHFIIIQNDLFNFWFEKMELHEYIHIKNEENMRNMILGQSSYKMNKSSQLGRETFNFSKVKIDNNSIKGIANSTGNSKNNLSDSKNRKSFQNNLKLSSVNIEEDNKDEVNKDEDNKDEDNKDEDETPENLQTLGIAEKKQGNYSEALTYFLAALDKHLKVHGENHPDTADLYNHLGSIYLQLGQFDKALEFTEKVLKIHQELLGEKHLVVAQVLNDLGNIHEEKGDHNKALEYYEKGLKIKEDLNSKEKDLVISYISIGNCYYNQKKFDNAIHYHNLAVKIQEKVSNKENSNIASSYNIIGAAYEMKGDYEKSIAFYTKTLEIKKQLYGSKHHDVCVSYQNIGNVYDSMRKYDLATTCYTKSIMIKKEILDANHPSLAASHDELAGTYYTKGDYDKAIENFTKALEIKISNFGPEHTEVAESYNNLGLIHERKEEFNQATEWYKKALDIYEKIYGNECLPIANCYNNFGNISLAKKEYQAAMDYYIKALGISQAIVGPKGSEIANSYYNLGLLHNEKGEHEKALEYHQIALNLRLELYEEAHIETAISHSSVGVTYFCLALYEKALPHHIKALEIREKILGLDHPDVAASYYNISKVYNEMGETQKSKEYFNKSLKINRENQ